MTCWAPFALIAGEISRRHDDLRGERSELRSERAYDETVHGGHAHACPEAGVILGIHNVAIAAPQVLATVFSWAIFRQMERPRGSVGDESVAWVLRFGGVSAVVAACLTRGVGEEGGRSGAS